MKIPIVYDPNNELTEVQLDELAEYDFDIFLNYLDQKVEHLKKFTRPLGTYETKHYAALTKGDALTTEELKKAKDIGKFGDEFRLEKIAEAASKLGDDPKYRDEGIKNLKTNRSQWFD